MSTPDFIEVILSRRSVRNYQQKTVAEGLIHKVLAAAMAAPSARHLNPWHFIVVKDHALLAKLAATNPHATMLHSAAFAIVVCGDTSVSPDYWVVDCSAAAQNILLAAHALGLGAVWTANYPKVERTEPVQKLLGLPTYVVPLCTIPIGWPEMSTQHTASGHRTDGIGQPASEAERFVLAKVHMEKW